jgi:heme O synthase-like polyprenyltransferase
MRKARILLIVGIWIGILPYLGFPHSWKDILTSLSGLGLIYLSYTFYKENKKKENEKTFDNFSENKFESAEEIK